MNREKDILKKWLDEAGREAPSPGFSSRVMATIKAQEAKRSVFKPAVSPRRVKLTVFGIAAIFAGIIFLTPNNNASTGDGYNTDSPVQNWLHSQAANATHKIAESINWQVFAPSELSYNPLFGYALLALALATMIKAYLGTSVISHRIKSGF